MEQVELTMTTQVPVSTQEAWAWSTSLKGVRAEMQPLLKIVFPKGMNEIGANTMLGKPLGRCQFLLFGLFPVDMSKLTFTEIVPGRRFVEQSPLLSMRAWRHERVVTPAGDGRGACVTDRLAFSPRFATPLVRAMVKLLFEHRHKVLARALGGQQVAPGRAGIAPEKARRDRSAW
ncbi:hypothetical protein [Telluria beijingensis]|uniref:hypothetical protein n=1 Tax=Telluria beijingensis TaxID=3068633 RepID=UPI0027959C56|nr:hypothetical protein [Massilia sp. REN29]